MSTPLRHHFARSLILTGILFGGAVSAQTLPYPPARKGAVVDDYHGTRVADPYRWLEAPSSAQSVAWLDAERKLTAQYFAGLPARERLRTRLGALADTRQTGVQWREGGRLLLLETSGNQPQS